ncbi:MAG: sulfatase-like hydrolase/transferase [Candidatus Curtissbacteria bacterium]
MIIKEMQLIRYITLFSFISIFTFCNPPTINNRKNANRESETFKWQSKRPNIVLMMSDDMGYSDVGSYGGEIETPVLDSLAKNGLRFSQFYNTARCCPTRASLLTGLYPAQTGLGFMTADEKMPGYRGEIGRQCVTIAEVLQQAGYGTYMSGKWHVARNLKDIDSLKYNWPLQMGV